MAVATGVRQMRINKHRTIAVYETSRMVFIQETVSSRAYPVRLKMSLSAARELAQRLIDAADRSEGRNTQQEAGG